MSVYYEDLEIGDVIDLGRYQMDKDEMIAFARQWDPRPFHVDEAFARTTIYGGLTASGTQTLAVYTKVCNEGTKDWPVRGALGYESLRFPKAVKPGDVLTGHSEILEKRVSKSRPELGLITSRETLTNQHGETVLEFAVTYLIERRELARPAES